jgi:hypothetical protein
MAYDSPGNPSSFTDRLGQTWGATYSGPYAATQTTHRIGATSLGGPSGSHNSGFPGFPSSNSSGYRSNNTSWNSAYPGLPGGPVQRRPQQQPAPRPAPPHRAGFKAPPVRQMRPIAYLPRVVGQLAHPLTPQTHLRQWLLLSS